MITLKSQWKEAAPLKRHPECTCEKIHHGLDTILAGKGYPKDALPATECKCGKTLVSRKQGSRTWHKQ